MVGSRGNLDGWKFSQATLKPTPSPTATVVRSSEATARCALAFTAIKRKRLSASRRFILPIAKSSRSFGFAFLHRAIDERALLLFERVEQLADLLFGHFSFLLRLAGIRLLLRLSLLRLFLFLVPLRTGLILLFLFLFVVLLSGLLVVLLLFVLFLVSGGLLFLVLF